MDFVKGIVGFLSSERIVFYVRLLNLDPQTIGYWTSGNDLDTEGHWVWGLTEGNGMTHIDWFPGEPNNVWYDGR